MKLICTADFEFTKSGTVLAPFYFKSGEIELPTKEWTENPVWLFSGWCDTLLAAIQNNQNEFGLLFMEGSYEIECTRFGEMLRIKFIEEHINDVQTCKLETVISFKDFVTDILANASSFLKEIQQSGSSSKIRESDFNALRKNTTRLYDWLKDNGSNFNLKGEMF